MLRASDVVWPEGGDPNTGVYAGAVLSSSQALSPGSALPGWLQDVAKLEIKGPVPPPAPNHRVPDWVEDVRLQQDIEAKDTAASSPSIEGLSHTVAPSPVSMPETPDYSVDEENSEPPVGHVRRAILIGALTALPFLTFVAIVTVLRILGKINW
jgi:hypothetical protein